MCWSWPCRRCWSCSSSCWNPALSNWNPMVKKDYILLRSWTLILQNVPLYFAFETPSELSTKSSNSSSCFSWFKAVCFTDKIHLHVVEAEAKFVTFFLLKSSPFWYCFSVKFDWNQISDSLSLSHSSFIQSDHFIFNFKLFFKFFSFCFVYIRFDFPLPEYLEIKKLWKKIPENILEKLVKMTRKK